MSGYSDIIKELSTTTPLNSGASYTTDKIIAGQYTSLTVSFASDQDITLVCQFSNDGSNFDISITKTFSAGSNYENLVIYGKWMRYLITNISVTNQTYLRIYTYASPNNNSLNAIISKVGNKYPEIQINGLPKGAFGEIKVENDTKLVDYVFTYGTDGAIGSGTFKLPYEGIKGYSASNGTLLRFANGLMSITNSTLQIGVGALVYGEQIQYDAGTGVMARFTGRFNQYTPRNNGSLGYQYQLLGIGNDNGSGVVSDFLGWGNVDTVSSTLSFGIHHFRNGVLVNSYPQNLWNIDKCDGTNIFPALNFKDYINVFQIQFQYLGAGAITFSIENPDTGLFEPVHMIRYANANTVSNLANPSLGLIMYQRTDATGTPASDADSISIASFCLSMEGKLNPSGDMYSLQASKTGISTLAPVLTIRNKTTFYSIKNRKPVQLYIFGASVDGTKNSDIIIRKNQALTGASWADANTNLTPVEYDTAGTLSGTGRNVLVFNLAKADKFHDDFIPYELIMFPGDSYTILAQSGASTDVSVSVTWKNM
jgi:hypothetical protein